jgi:hypothetical protein
MQNWSGILTAHKSNTTQDEAYPASVDRNIYCSFGSGKVK